MRLFDLIPVQFRIAVVGGLLLMVTAGSAALTWTAQDWRYGRVLERQARLQADTLNEISKASADLQQGQGRSLLAHSLFVQPSCCLSKFQ